MDPISTAILAAISAGVLTGATKIADQVISDGYLAIKQLLRRKFGTKSEIVKAVKALEAKPDSEARIGVLREEITTAKADQDAELLQAAQVLLEKLGFKPDNTNIKQVTIGDQNIQVAGSKNSINMNIPKSNK